MSKPIVMSSLKRVTVREDLMNKTEYSKRFHIDRVSLNRSIEQGVLEVEQISGHDYVKIKPREYEPQRKWGE